MDSFSHTKKMRRGFTLAEMAIVVVLAGIIMTMGLKMTVASLNNAANSDTVNKQAQIKQALISFLRTNGRLPCPDTTASPAQPLGSEAAKCSGAGLNPGSANGVIPWSALQLSRDVAIDGWGNYFHYQVQNGTTPKTHDWTTNNSAVSFNVGDLTAQFPDMTIKQRLSSGTPLTTVTSLAVVVIISGGKNGFGTKTLLGQPNAPVPGINVDETSNVTPILNTFVMRPYSEVAGGGGAFDDIVTYMVPQDLLQPLITEQTVLTCRAYCHCIGPGNPDAYCTGLNLPATSPSKFCNSAGPGCTGPANPPGCTVPAATTTPIPIGSPTASCP